MHQKLLSLQKYLTFLQSCCYRCVELRTIMYFYTMKKNMCEHFSALLSHISIVILTVFSTFFYTRSGQKV